MRFFLITLITAILLAGSYSQAAEYMIEINWIVEEAPDIAPAGFRLYDLEQNKICDTEDPLATELVCTVEAYGTKATFTLVSYSADGIESDPSAPFTIVLDEPEPLLAIINHTITEGTLTATFDAAASTGSITQYTWEFNDGSQPDSSPTVNHTFPAAGIYTVSLTVEDESSGTSSTTTQEITLSQGPENNLPPSAALVITSPVLGNAPLAVNFDAGSSSDPEDLPLTFSWDFGDGTTAAGITAEHLYTTVGTYKATVTVTDSLGAVDSAVSQPIMVTAGDGTSGTATAAITTGSTSVPAAMIATFSGINSIPSASEGTVTGYSWIFGDGTTGTGQEIQHIFNLPGQYEIMLTITDSNGKQDTATLSVTVYDPATRPQITPLLIEAYKLLILKDEGGVEVPVVPQVVETSITSGADDIEEYTGTGEIDWSSTDLEMIEEREEQIVGLRFNSLAIPQNASITKAWIQFTVDETTSRDTSLIITGEKSGNPESFSTSRYNLTSRNQTASAVDWQPPPWTTKGASGLDQRTSNLKIIIQELVNLADWNSGNSMVFIISGEGSRVAESYDGVADSAAVLHVEFIINK